jgi:hypothetical protein
MSKFTPRHVKRPLKSKRPFALSKDTKRELAMPKSAKRFLTALAKHRVAMQDEPFAAFSRDLVDPCYLEANT